MSERVTHALLLLVGEGRRLGSLGRRVVAARGTQPFRLRLHLAGDVGEGAHDQLSRRGKKRRMLVKPAAPRWGKGGEEESPYRQGISQVRAVDRAQELGGPLGHARQLVDAGDHHGGGVGCGRLRGRAGQEGRGGGGEEGEAHRDCSLGVSRGDVLERFPVD